MGGVWDGQPIYIFLLIQVSRKKTCTPKQDRRGACQWDYYFKIVLRFRLECFWPFFILCFNSSDQTQRSWLQGHQFMFWIHISICILTYIDFVWRQKISSTVCPHASSALWTCEVTQPIVPIRLKGSFPRAALHSGFSGCGIPHISDSNQMVLCCWKSKI